MRRNEMTDLNLYMDYFLERANKKRQLLEDKQRAKITKQQKLEQKRQEAQKRNEVRNTAVVPTTTIKSNKSNNLNINTTEVTNKDGQSNQVVENNSPSWQLQPPQEQGPINHLTAMIKEQESVQIESAKQDIEGNQVEENTDDLTTDAEDSDILSERSPLLSYSDVESEEQNYFDLNKSEYDDALGLFRSIGPVKVTFLIGPEALEERCYKQPFANASDVFHRMFFGTDGQSVLEGPFRLPGISQHTFQLMVKFVYFHDPQFKFIESVCDMLPAARTYKLEGLIQICRSYLWSHMNKDDVWKVLEVALENYEQHLYESALQMVQLHGKDALNTYEFEQVSSGTVSTVVKLENINIDCEFILLHAVVRWSMAEVERHSNETPAPTLQQIFAPFKSHIRFLSITPQQFATVSIDNNFLSKEEMLLMLLKLTLPDRNLKSPMFLNKNVTPRTVYYVDNIPLKCVTLNVGKQMFNESGSFMDMPPQLCNDVFDWISTMYITINNLDDILYGVRVPKNDRHADDIITQETLDEKWSVYVIDVTSGECVYTKTVKTSQISDTGGDVIILFGNGINFSQNPLFNTREQSESKIKIKVIIHESGSYPLTLSKSRQNEIEKYQGKPNFVLRRPLQHSIIIAALLNK